jgi:hypothetical protein
MNPIDEQVILATLDEGGKTFVGNFSTIHIAQKSGVSEFVILDRFESRENLLEQSMVYLEKKFQTEILEVCRRARTFEETFSSLVDYLLDHPTWNGFFLNYGYLTPQCNPNKDQEAAFNEWLMDEGFELAKLSSRLKSLPSPSVFDLFRYFLRELVSFSQTLISAENVDSPALRSRESAFLFQGLSGQLQGDLGKGKA